MRRRLKLNVAVDCFRRYNFKNSCHEPSFRIKIFFFFRLRKGKISAYFLFKVLRLKTVYIRFKFDIKNVGVYRAHFAKLIP